MPKVIYKHVSHKLPELGDLKHRITIYSREIKSPTDATGNYSLNLTQAIKVWASIETIKGDILFDSVNMERSICSLITIRYLPFITQEYWIAYNNTYYDILQVEDLNEQRRFQVLYCNVRGSTSKEVNKA